MQPKPCGNSGLFGPHFCFLGWHKARRRHSFAAILPSSFDAESLPEPASVVSNYPYFLVCVIVLVTVLICYFLAPLLGLEPYIFAFTASAVLLSVPETRTRVLRTAAREARSVSVHSDRQLKESTYAFDV